MSTDTPRTDALSTDPAIDKRDVPARVWREMAEIELDLSAKTAECDALRKDAERYRWLKQNADTDGSTHRIYMELNIDEWDETIDEAIADAALGAT